MLDTATLEAFLLAAGISGLICFACWPNRKPLPTDDYLNLLDPVRWKEEAALYEEILKIHPMLDLNDHNQTLAFLYSKGMAERLISKPNSVEEADSPERFHGVYRDHIEPFSTITAIYYRRTPQKGGRRKKLWTLFPSFPRKANPASVMRGFLFV